VLRTLAAVITGASKVNDRKRVDVCPYRPTFTLRAAPRFRTGLPCWTRCVTQESEVCDTQDADSHVMKPYVIE